MSDRQPLAFELRVLPEQGDRYRLALWQQRLTSNGSSHAEMCHLATLRGTPLQVAIDQILDVLRREGHRPTTLRPSQAATLPVSEETGVRLGLLFLALRPLTKVVRMEAIAAGIRNMPAEEAYYWFSKCVASGNGRQAQRALRVLLARD